MQASYKAFTLGAIAVLAAFGSMVASAQSTGADYHPMQLNSAARPELDAEAVAAAHPPGTEPIGMSTSAPMLASTVSSDEVYKGAVAAAHPSGTEPVGMSTSLPMVNSASGE